MYRLTDDLAQQRLYYPPPVASAPHAILIDLPPQMRGPGLLLDRYYLVLPETDAELEEFERFLDEPRGGPTRPSLLDERASAVASDNLLVIRYAPRIAQWPWLSICRWPDDLSPTITRHLPMARGCYSFEAFLDQGEMDRHSTELLSSLQGHVEISIRFLASDQSGSVIGHA